MTRKLDAKVRKEEEEEEEIYLACLGVIQL